MCHRWRRARGTPPHLPPPHQFCSSSTSSRVPSSSSTTCSLSGNPPCERQCSQRDPHPTTPPPSHPHTPPLPPQSVTGGGARIGGERGGISGARAGGGAQKGSRPPPSRCAGRVPPWAAHCAGGVTRIGPPTPPPRFASCSVRRGNASKIPTAAGWDGPFRPIGRGALWGGCQTRGGRKGRRGGGDPPNTSREERGGNLPS